MSFWAARPRVYARGRQEVDLRREDCPSPARGRPPPCCRRTGCIAMNRCCFPYGTWGNASRPTMMTDPHRPVKNPVTMPASEAVALPQNVDSLALERSLPAHGPDAAGPLAGAEPRGPRWSVGDRSPGVGRRRVGVSGRRGNRRRAAGALSADTLRRDLPGIRGRRLALRRAPDGVGGRAPLSPDGAKPLGGARPGPQGQRPRARSTASTSPELSSPIGEPHGPTVDLPRPQSRPAGSPCARLRPWGSGGVRPALRAPPAALGQETAALARTLTRDEGAALTAWAAVVGPPTFAYSFHLYTELPSALAGVVALRLLTGSPGALGAGVAAVAAASLPWLHLKMIPAAAVLGTVGLLKLRGRPLVCFVAVTLVMAALFAAYYQAIFGIPTPLALYGGGVPPGTSHVASPGGRRPPSRSLLRPPALRPRLPPRFRGAATSASLGPGGRPGGARRGRGGGRPHSRLADVVGRAVSAGALPRPGGALPGPGCGPRHGLSRRPHALANALLGAGLGLALFMAAVPEARMMLNRGDRQTRVWTALSGTRDVGAYLPSLVADTPAERRVAALWVLAVALLLALDALARRRPGVDLAFRGLGLPLLLALGIGVLVDGWARAGESPPAGSPPVNSTGGAASVSRPS